MKKLWISFLCGLLFLLLAPTAKANFDNILKKARGQTVYFNAWGGSELYNNYINWAAKQMRQIYGVRVKHVRLTDTAIAVNQVLTDKKAGNKKNGAIDVLWINGNNFKTMKDNRLLYGPFIKKLPNYKLLSVRQNPALLKDFTIAVDGLEMPWGRAYFVFVYDSKKTPNPPKTADELLSFAKNHHGKLSYPTPPDFTGVAFLKHLLLDLAHKNGKQRYFKKSFKNEAVARKRTKFLWDYLDQLHPHLWQAGKNFPKNESDLLKLFARGKLSLSFSYNAGVASAAIKQKIVPPSVKTYIWHSGVLSNQHYLAIPFNSQNKEAAMVFINFLSSPIAQGRKTNTAFWGEPTVLDVGRLKSADKNIFMKNAGVSAIKPIKAKTLPEPHPDWTSFLEQEWKKRYFK
ncbi:MAG: ABC transporter substrate-binding protein [Alphaproteobacteria bacterium]